MGCCPGLCGNSVTEEEFDQAVQSGHAVLKPGFLQFLDPKPEEVSVDLGFVQKYVEDKDFQGQDQIIFFRNPKIKDKFTLALLIKRSGETSFVKSDKLTRFPVTLLYHQHSKYHPLWLVLDKVKQSGKDVYKFTRLPNIEFKDGISVQQFDEESKAKFTERYFILKNEIGRSAECGLSKNNIGHIKILNQKASFSLSPLCKVEQGEQKWELISDGTNLKLIDGY
jgi:hypothetical protein